MTRSTMAKRAGIGAALVFFAGAAFEVARVAARKPWAGIVPEASDVVGIFLAVLWVASGVTCVVGRQRFAVIPIFGAFALLTHFVVTRAAGSPIGLVYLAAVPFAVLLTWMAFGRELHLHDVHDVRV